MKHVKRKRKKRATKSKEGKANEYMHERKKVHTLRNRCCFVKRKREVWTLEHRNSTKGSKRSSLREQWKPKNRKRKK